MNPAVKRLTAALVGVLSACSGLRPEPPPQGTLSHVTPPAPEPDTDQPPSTVEKSPNPVTAAPMDCMPPAPRAEPQPQPKATSKPKRRPKPVHKAAPPQLPTAPLVVATPPGGVLRAKVEPMPLPVMSILGKSVKGPKGEDMGRVVDVLADATGRVRVAIIDFGGFLGVGDRRIAVDWPLLRFNVDGGDPSLLLSVDREQLKTAPEYKGSVRPEALMEPEPVTVTP